MIVLNKNLESRNIIINNRNASSNKGELVSVDLSIGDRYRAPGESNWTEIRDHYKLRPGHCVLIRTEEEIKLPNNIFASVFSRGSLSAKGLTVSNTKIDPLFSGHLHIPVFNAGKGIMELKKGFQFCSVVFYTLEQPVAGNAQRRAVDIDKKKTSIPFLDILNEYLPHIITGLVTIVGSAVVTYVTIKLTPPPQNLSSPPNLVPHK